MIDAIVSEVNNILYKPYVVPLLLMAVGIWYTVRTRFIQIRLFGEMFRVVLDRPKSEDGISSFGALMVSTASRVGTGNIIGVATAIMLGGPGAIFWMWITALIGGANAFIESTLAQIYKRRSHDGSSYGGPSFYMRDALGQGWLGVVFAFLIIFTYAVGYNMLAAYNLQSTFNVFHFYNEYTPSIIGLILAILYGIIVIGGAKRLFKVTTFLVPLMGVLYIIIAVVVLVLNASNILPMIKCIFASAFDFNAIFGGFAGSCIMWGIKRGLYSNEAGMGSAPNASARADVSHPVKQGLVQTLSVFIDTLLICTATALMCLSCVEVIPGEYVIEGGANAGLYVQTCMKTTLGTFGTIFLAIAMSLFAFTTLIGNYSYCEGCLSYILNRHAKKSELLIFRIFSTILVFLGAISSAALVWDTADMAQGLMVVCNIPTIAIIGGVAVKALKDYCKQRKDGKDPHFLAKDVGLNPDTLDYWK